jgi:RNA polymerase sigma factor (sigma-70 family)
LDRFNNHKQVWLYEKWRPALTAYFMRRVGNHAEAEDLTQEVFIRLLRSDFSEGAPNLFIFRVAQNLLIDRARRASVRRRYRQSVLAADELEIDPLDPQRVAIGRAELARLGSALEALPERTRVMFTLYRIDKMSQDEIGDAFGISKSAVKKQIASAMAIILRRMRDEA